MKTQWEMRKKYCEKKNCNGDFSVVRVTFIDSKESTDKYNSFVLFFSERPPRVRNRTKAENAATVLMALKRT